MPTYNRSTDFSGEGFAGIAHVVIEGDDIPDDLLNRVKVLLREHTEYGLGRWKFPRLPKEAFGVRTLIWKVEREVNPPVYQVSSVSLTLRCWVSATTPVSGLDVTLGTLGTALLGMILDELRLRSLNAKRTETPVSPPVDTEHTDALLSSDGLVHDLLSAVDRFADGLSGLLGDTTPTSGEPEPTLSTVAAALFDDAAALVRTVSARLNPPQSSSAEKE